mgnify:CR=1 FL=1
MELSERLWQAIRGLHLLKPDSTVVVGCSGGPDSVALVFLLRDLSAKHRMGLRLHLAHLHHMIRGAEADEDQRFVEALAERLAVPYDVGRENVPELSRQRKRSVEEVGRQARYEFLRHVADRVGARTVAVGHTADDQAETVLAHLLRGCGLQGLRGMAVRRPLGGPAVELVRPLLFVTRKQIEEYLEVCKETCRIDATNETLDYRRNRIRHELLPLLEAHYNSNIRRVLVRLSHVAGEAHEYLESKAAESLQDVTVPEVSGGLVIHCERLLELNPAMQRQVLRRALAHLQGYNRLLSAAHIDELLRFARESASGRVLELPGGLTVLKEYQNLKFRLGAPRVRPLNGEGVELAVPGSTLLPEHGFEVRAETLPANPEFFERLRGEKALWEEFLDVAAVELPLRMRTWRSGDRIQPLGLGGTKKLQDLFTDRKVPRERRAAVPVVADGSGRPIWVVGLGIDESVKVRECTEQILRLKLLPLPAGARRDKPDA